MLLYAFYNVVSVFMLSVCDTVIHQSIALCNQPWSVAEKFPSQNALKCPLDRYRVIHRLTQVVKILTVRFGKNLRKGMIQGKSTLYSIEREIALWKGRLHKYEQVWSNLLDVL